MRSTSAQWKLRYRPALYGAVLLPAALLAASSFGSPCSDGMPGVSTWSITEPDGTETYDNNATITCMGSGPCIESATVELTQHTMSGDVIVDTASISVDENEHWECTFEPPAGGWNPGNYTIKVDGDDNPPDKESDTFSIIIS